MNLEELNKWKSSWLSGMSVSGPSDFENDLDCLALASLMQSTAVFPIVPRETEEFPELMKVENPVSPEVRTRALASLDGVSEIYKEMVALFIKRRGYTVLPEDWQAFARDPFLSFDVYRWKIWEKGIFWKEGAWVFDRSPTWANAMSVLNVGLPDRAAAAEFMARYVQSVATPKQKEELIGWLKARYRVEYRVVLDVLNEEEIKDKAIASVLRFLKERVEEFSVKENRMKAILDIVKVEKKILRRSQVVFEKKNNGIYERASLALSMMDGQDIVEICPVEEMLGCPGDREHVFLESAIRSVLSFGDKRMAFERLVDYYDASSSSWRLALDVAGYDNFEVEPYLNRNWLSWRGPSVLFLSSSREVSMDKIVDSSAWTEALKKIEQDERGSQLQGYAMLVPLVLMVSANEAEAYLETAPPSMALTLGPVWNLLKLNATLKKENSNV